MEDKKYEYRPELEGTRTTRKEDEHWYMQQPMTGAEAMRACQIALKRWYNDHKGEEVLWLWMMLGSDPALYEDWALSVDEMLDERNAKIKVPGIPYWLENTRFEPCACCDKCKYKN
jgi:hypothetical protein